MLGHAYLAGTGDSSPPRQPPGGSGPTPVEQEDLPYRVELWDPAKKAVEQVLAVTANSSIGYAAYNAATRDYVDRYVTLRYKGNVLIRWNSPVN